ncbi:MAG: FMN-binding protein [bacterium]
MAERRSTARYRRVIAWAVLVLLAGALWYGRSHRSLELAPHLQELFPGAERVEAAGKAWRVLDGEGRLLGWAGVGEGQGYGGPMLVAAGIDTLGRLVGGRVVEHRETPIFFRLLRPERYFDQVRGRRYENVDQDYEAVTGITGATRSSGAVVEGVRSSLAAVVREGLGGEVPRDPRPFEFGTAEIVVLLLLFTAIAASRLGGTRRRRLRWLTQVTGLVVIGFWQASPITLAKITSLASGFFPDPRTELVFYLLAGAFLLTTLLYRRNFYCVYLCPFGATQRCVGVIGGMRLKVPVRIARAAAAGRNLLVFALAFAALVTLQPASVTYEPFSALFTLTGTTLQWLLLGGVLVGSLFLSAPWCTHLCPMRSVEVWLRALWGRGGRGTPAPRRIQERIGEAGSPLQAAGPDQERR